jgi:hypothetical protein
MALITKYTGKTFGLKDKPVSRWVCDGAGGNVRVPLPAPFLFTGYVRCCLRKIAESGFIPCQPVIDR